MIDLKKRSRELEIMDLPNPNPREIRLAIQEIETINRLLGGFNQTLEDLENFMDPSKTLEIQDWGCGSGDMLRKIAHWAKKKKQAVVLNGWDIDSETLEYARERSRGFHINYIQADVLAPEIKENSTDIVCSCLFTHHFTNEDWIKLVQKMLFVSKRGVIINDLHRHPLAYYSIKFLTRIFAKSYMVQNDAALSVAKGFKKAELIYLLDEAGIKTYKIRWKWAFRWSLVLFKN